MAFKMTEEEWAKQNMLPSSKKVAASYEEQAALLREKATKKKLKEPATKVKAKARNSVKQNKELIKKLRKRTLNRNSK